MTKKVTIELDEYKNLLADSLRFRILCDVGRIHKIYVFSDIFNDENLTGYFPEFPRDGEDLFDMKLEQIFKEAESKTFEEDLR